MPILDVVLGRDHVNVDDPKGEIAMRPHAGYKAAVWLWVPFQFANLLWGAHLAGTTAEMSWLEWNGLVLSQVRVSDARVCGTHATPPLSHRVC